MAYCKRCGKKIHRTYWTWNGWKHFAFMLSDDDGWTKEDRDHNASPR